MCSEVTAVALVTLNHLKYATKEIAAQSHRYFKQYEGLGHFRFLCSFVLSPSVHDGIYSV